jgi:hypothetical protein
MLRESAANYRTEGAGKGKVAPNDLGIRAGVLRDRVHEIERHGTRRREVKRGTRAAVFTAALVLGSPALVRAAEFPGWSQAHTKRPRDDRDGHGCGGDAARLSSEAIRREMGYATRACARRVVFATGEAA